MIYTAILKELSSSFALMLEVIIRSLGSCNMFFQDLNHSSNQSRQKERRKKK